MTNRSGNGTENLISDFAIPNEDQAKQAVSALRGYAYQLYQSLAAWISLGPEQELHLEVAEDYAVLARQACMLAQVKDTPSSSVTLNSKSIQEAIESFWRIQNANQQCQIQLRFLTTAVAGKERTLEFPNGGSGLSYWRTAALEMASVDPIRAALLSIGFSDGLQSFIRSASPEELRDRLIRPISFDCGAKAIAGIQQEILDKLIYFGEDRGLLPSDAEAVFDPLLVRVLHTAISKLDRRLTKIDFLRTFEQHTSISISKSQIRNLVNQFGKITGQFPEANLELRPDINEEWLDPKLLEREKVVSSLWTALGISGTLWLHGSSGIGKSTLAQLVAARGRGRHLRFEFRDLSNREIAARIRIALSRTNQREVDGLILDDLPGGLDPDSLKYLSILTQSLRRADKYIIVTSARGPINLTRDALNGCHVTAAPYLTKEEVGQLVRVAGGDEALWSQTIYLFCSQGHTQLVAARISGLVRRGWPSSELYQVWNGAVQFDDVEEERTSVRIRLLDELEESHRDLLYRLALVFGRFDKELVFAVSTLPTAVPRPGEVLDSLSGPWIEQLGPDQFKISPLISGAGSKVLSSQDQTTVHKAIIDDLLRRKPFPLHLLGTLLSHAVIIQHLPALYWIAGAVLTANEHQQAIAEELSLLTIMKLESGEQLVPSDRNLSCLLRVAQLRIASRLNNRDPKLISIVERVEDESIGVDRRLATHSRFFALSTILAECAVVLPVSSWLRLLREFNLLVKDPAFNDFSKSYASSGTLNDPLAISHLLFLGRARNIKHISELSELFLAIDLLDPDFRSEIISVFRAPNDAANLVVAAGWLREANDSLITEVRAIEIAKELHALAVRAGSWGEPDIVVELFCAEIVVLDEYANRKEEALAAAKNCERQFPTDRRIARRCHMIHLRAGEYKAAIECVNGFEEHLEEMGDIAAAHFGKQVGKCYAELGDLENAAKAFSLGLKRAESAMFDSMLPMQIGLLADLARVEFELSRPMESAQLIQQSLDLAAQLPSSGGAKQRWPLAGVGHTLNWFWSKAEGESWRLPRVDLSFGFCSDSAPDSLADSTCPSILFLRYVLAIVEQSLTIDIGALTKVRQLTTFLLIPQLDFVLSVSVMSNAIKNNDVRKFCTELPNYLSVASRCMGKAEVGMESSESLARAVFEEAKPSVEAIEYAATNASAALLSGMLSSGSYSEAKEAARRINEIVSIPESVKTMLQVFLYPERNIETWEQQMFRCLGWASQGDILTSDRLFHLTLTVWHWIPRSEFGSTVAWRCSEYLRECWRSLAVDRSFTLKIPRKSVPAILAAVESSNSLSARARIASILLAAENEAEVRIGDSSRAEMINSLAAKAN